MLLLFFAFQAANSPLSITCNGGGTANKATATQVYTRSNVHGSIGTTPVSGFGSTQGTVFGQRHEGFADQVDIRLFTGDDRIRLPRTMLPPIHGGDDGWFKLKDVEVDARTIKAKASVNFVNSPKVYIDRMTGSISISGKAGHYSGQCEAVAGDASQKF